MFLIISEIYLFLFRTHVKIRKVILDASLGGYRLNLLKDECRGLGLDYIDMSPKGSYRILL